MTCTTYRQILFLLTFLLHGTHTTFCEKIPTTRVPVPCKLKPFEGNTLIVTNNADDINDSTTLRGALAFAQAGDLIIFNLPAGFDEIILDPDSPLIVDTTVIIDGSNLAGSGSGEQRITINGDFTNDNVGDTNICFRIEPSAPASTIKNVIIKQFNGHSLIDGSGTGNVEEPAYGIYITSNAIACTITNCSITDIISGENQPSAGIFSEADTCPITDNTVTNISSVAPIGSAAINSGDVWGIHVIGTISGNCADNFISNISSGDSNTNSGLAMGVDVNFLDGSFFNNTINQVNSGNALSGQSGQIIGVRIGQIRGTCIDNNIMQLTSGIAENESGFVSGLQSAIIQGKCAENIIHTLTSGRITATGLGSMKSGAIFGIRSGNTFHNDVRNNDISLLQSGDGYQSGDVIGVLNSANIIGNFIENTITGLFSGAAISNSGNVNGSLFLSIQGSFINNNIGGQHPGNAALSGLESGVSNMQSGNVVGYTFENNEGDIANNIITNLASGNAEQETGFVYGIQGGNAFSDCAKNNITFLSSGDIEPAGTDAGAATSGEIIGITITNVNGTCIENLITDLSSGIALGTNNTSGDVTGVSFKVLLGRLWSNTILRLASGAADNTSGNVIGIIIDTYLRGDAANNTVKLLMAGNANAIGYVRGIWLVMVQYNRLIACNSVDCMQGGNDEEDSFGLAIEMGDQLSVCQNKITNLIGMNSTVIHGMLFGNENEGHMLTNSIISDNFIQNIMSENNTNGFGITILNSNSLGNRLLNNSIFEINGKAINIVNNNVDTDAGTIVTAPIICNWIICAGKGTIRISGNLFPHSDFNQDEFLLQFFASDANTPPQAMTFIGETTIEADGSPTPFTVEFKPTTALIEGQFLTATATALINPNKNTSEVSPPIVGCNSARPECIIAMLDCIEPLDPCPISLEDAPPLEPPCIGIPCGPCPCL